jgi:hypothetical protein
MGWQGYRAVGEAVNRGAADVETDRRMALAPHHPFKAPSANPIRM